MRDEADTPSAELLETLREAHALGCATYGLRRFDPKSFSRRAIEWLEERLGESGLPSTHERMAQLLELAPKADLVLLLAARHGDRREAMEAFRTVHGGRIASYYRVCGAGEAESVDLASETLEALTFGAFRRSRRPAFYSYRARAPIKSWLAGFVRRDWSTRMRSRSRREAHESDLGVASDWPLVARGTSPAEGLDAAEIGELVYEALVESVEKGTVPVRDLKPFCYWMLSRQEQQHLAAKLDVHPATFSRRKKRCNEALGEVIKEHLMRRMRPADFVTVCTTTNLELSEKNVRLYKPIRAFCRWTLRRLHRREAEAERGGGPA